MRACVFEGSRHGACCAAGYHQPSSAMPLPMRSCYLQQTAAGNKSESQQSTPFGYIVQLKNTRAQQKRTMALVRGLGLKTVSPCCFRDICAEHL